MQTSAKGLISTSMETSAPDNQSDTVSTVRYLMDARGSFPYTPTPPRRPGVPIQNRQTVQEWASSAPAAAALDVLPSEERIRVRRFLFPKDAALSLASFLLKHLAISQSLEISWSDSKLSQKRTIRNGKPFYDPGGIDFNVSHHGEASVLVATTVPGAQVGIDLVHVDIETSLRAVRSEGWKEWARTYRDVFSDQEMLGIVDAVPAGQTQTDAVLISGLRRFYSHWALKEAYFKMTSDGLTADYLKDLEFGDIIVPQPAVQDFGENKWAWGATTRPTVTLRGEAVEGVLIELTALGEHYMVATAVRGITNLPDFSMIDVQEDILQLSHRT